MGGPDPQRNPRLLFQRRSNTLRKKARQLSEKCGARVYLLVDHPRANYVYNSSNDPSWPPPDKELDTHYPNIDRYSFGSTRVLESQPPYDSNMHTPPRDSKKLENYFATRLEALCELEVLHKSVNSVAGDAEIEKLSITMAESSGGW